MTIGQRIAQKRKELGLSQEDLGERLGVSRQAIYKWESDSALPEVEKLVRLSQLFSVTVGWILGTEEDSSPDSGGELTPSQLQMVEDITGRYIAAMPRPAEPKRRRWPAVLVCAAIVLLTAALALTVAGFGALSARHEELQTELHDLRGELDALNGRLDSLPQGGNPSQPEAPLLGPVRNTDWDVTVTEVDASGETAVFDVWIRPAEEAGGLNCRLVVTLDGEDSAYAFEPLAGGLTARVTAPIADNTTLSVLFYSENRSELYPLVSYTHDDLMTNAFPVASILGDRLLLVGVTGDTVQARALPVSVDSGTEQAARVAQLRVGLFRDRELVIWYEESAASTFSNGTTSWDRPELTLERGHVYCEAVVVTDESGQERVFFAAPIEYSDQWQLVRNVDGAAYNSDPDNWTY